MASLPPVPLTVRADVLASLDGQQVMTTFHYAGNSPWTAPTMQDLADAILAYYSANMDKFPETYVLEQVVVRDLSEEEGASVIASPTSVTNGSLTGPYLPNNATFAVKRKTAVGGRSGHGRVYHPGLAQQWLFSANQLLSSVSLALATFYQTMMQDINADNINGAVEVIVSYWHNKVLRTPPATYAVLVYTTTDNYIDSQRRRLPGRGN